MEDSAELQIVTVPNLVSLETRNANTEGRGEITIRDLIRTSLRMRPNRIVVGEVRGAECLDMLQAMNTGHDGSLSTGHSNSALDMLSRLETMVLSAADLPVTVVRQQISSAINIFVHLSRLRDRSRRVMEISEVAGIRSGEVILNPLYEFRESGEQDGRVQGGLRCAATLFCIQTSCGWPESFIIRSSSMRVEALLRRRMYLERHEEERPASPVRQNKGFMKRTPPVLPVSASQGESRYCCRIIPYTS